MLKDVYGDGWDIHQVDGLTAPKEALSAREDTGQTEY